MLKVGQYTNKGWVVGVWTPNAHDKPVTLTEPAAYAVLDDELVTWRWASEVEPLETEATLPKVHVVDRKYRHGLIKFLAPYGGNAWVARQVGITKPTVVYILGNRVWPPASVVAQELRAADGSYSTVARRLNTTVGNLHRVEAIGNGASDRTYGGKPVNPYPTFHGKR